MAQVTALADEPGQLRHILARWVSARRIDVAIGAPDWEVASMWGDYHFGRALQRAIQQRGHPTKLRLRSAWDGPAAGRADAALHVFGLAERPTQPGQVSALWIDQSPGARHR